MIIEAKFIGKNSLGYEHGKTYKLKLKGNTITRIDGSGVCVYESLVSFLQNWVEIITA